MLFVGGLLAAFKNKNMTFPLCRTAGMSQSSVHKEMLTGSRVLIPPIHSSTKRALSGITCVLKFLKEPLHCSGSHSSSTVYEWGTIRLVMPFLCSRCLFWEAEASEIDLGKRINEMIVLGSNPLRLMEIYNISVCVWFKATDENKK